MTYKEFLMPEYRVTFVGPRRGAAAVAMYFVPGSADALEQAARDRPNLNDGRCWLDVCRVKQASEECGLLRWGYTKCAGDKKRRVTGVGSRRLHRPSIAPRSVAAALPFTKECR